MAFAGRIVCSLPPVLLPPTISFKMILLETLSFVNLLYPAVASPRPLCDELRPSAELPVLRMLRLAEDSRLRAQTPCKSGLYVGRHAQMIAVPSSMVHNFIFKEIEATVIRVSRA